MNTQLVTLYTYSNREDAADAMTILLDHGIEYAIEDCAPSLDPFAAYTAAYSIYLKVKEEDVERALDLITSSLGENISEEIREVTTESLMEKYSNEELREVIYKKDEWEEDDIAQAERILRKRGITVTQEEKESMWQKRLEETRRPQQGSTGWIVFGFAVALMGGFFGVVVGASYFFVKKRDMLGKKHYIYTKSTRMMGLVMMLIGIAVMLFSMSIFFDFWILPGSL